MSEFNERDNRHHNEEMKGKNWVSRSIAMQFLVEPDLGRWDSPCSATAFAWSLLEDLVF